MTGKNSIGKYLLAIVISFLGVLFIFQPQVVAQAPGVWYAGDGTYQCDGTNFITYYDQTNCLGKAGYVTQGIASQTPCSADGSGLCFKAGGQTISHNYNSLKDLSNRVCVNTATTQPPANMYDALYQCAWRRDLCSFATTDKQTVNPGQTVTISSQSKEKVNNFFYAFYNMENTFSPGNPQPICVTTGGDALAKGSCPSGSHSFIYNDTNKSMRTDGSVTLSYDQIFTMQDQNNSGQVVRYAQVNAYFNMEGQPASIIDKNCVVQIFSEGPTPTPYYIAATPTPPATVTDPLNPRGCGILYTSGIPSCWCNSGGGQGLCGSLPLDGPGGCRDLCESGSFSGPPGYTHCYLMPDGSECRSNDDGTYRFCENQCLSGNPGFIHSIGCQYPNKTVIGNPVYDISCSEALNRSSNLSFLAILQNWLNGLIGVTDIKNFTSQLVRVPGVQKATCDPTEKKCTPEWEL